MGTAQQALAKAAGEIGYYAPDDPEPGSKYGRWLAAKWNQPWLAGPSVRIWWCAIFQSWVLDGTASLAGIPNFNTDRLLSAARPAGAVLADPRAAEPGDLVIFDWNRATPATDHVGMVELNQGDYLQTIEGNTAGSAGGRQSNGNGVWRRTRSWDSVVAIIRPAYDAAVVPVSNPVAAPAPVRPAPPAPPRPIVVSPGIPAPPFPLPHGWYFGPREGPVQSVSGLYSHRGDLRRWQQRMKDRGWAINPDGFYGSQTAGVAHDFQVEKGLAVDSLIGPQTWGAAWTAPVTR